MKNFNKILFVCIAVFAISFSSCKKINPPIEEDPILGTWTLVDTQLEFASSNPMYAALLNQFISVDELIEFPNPLIFNENGTGSGVTSFTTMQFDYIKTESQITFKKMAFYFGGNYGDDLIADYQLLDNNKTLKMNLDVTTTAMPMLIQLLEFYLSIGEFPIPIDVESIVSSISKIECIVIYNK